MQLSSSSNSGVKISKYLTVIFQIDNKESFKEMSDKILNRFSDGFKDTWSVSAMSHGDEVSRLELLEQAVDLTDCQLVQDILDHDYVDYTTSLKDFGVEDD